MINKTPEPFFLSFSSFWPIVSNSFHQDMWVGSRWLSSSWVLISTYFFNKIYLDYINLLQQAFPIVKFSDLTNSALKNAI